MCDIHRRFAFVILVLGGGIHMSESNLTIDGIASFVNNSAGTGGKQRRYTKPCFLTSYDLQGVATAMFAATPVFCLIVQE